MISQCAHSIELVVYTSQLALSSYETHLAHHSLITKKLLNVTSLTKLPPVPTDTCYRASFTEVYYEITHRMDYAALQSN